MCKIILSNHNLKLKHKRNLIFEKYSNPIHIDGYFMFIIIMSFYKTGEI